MARKTRGMILAAGLGTRLRPLTYFRAKAAVPFLNRPLISYSLELFKKAQINEIMINLHHLSSTVKEAVADESANLHFSLEEEILGTAGCLGKVRDFLEQDRFVVSNGKTYCEQDLSEVLDQHQRSGALVTMVLVPYASGDPYNPVFLDSENNVTGFARNRPQHLEGQSPGVARLGIYTGIQVLEPEVLDWIPSGVSDSVNQIYPRLMEQGHSIKGYVSDAYWCECSTPKRYLANSLEVLEKRKSKNLASTSLPTGCRGAVLGERVSVPSDTLIENSVFWGNTKLGSSSSFRGVIVADGVDQLPPDTHLRDVIITPIIEESEAFRTVERMDDRYALWPAN